MKKMASILFWAILSSVVMADHEFGDPSKFAVRFDDKTGNLTEVVYKGEIVTRPNEPGTKPYSAQSPDRPAQAFDISLDGQWQYGKHPVELVSMGKEKNSNAFNVTKKFGDWLLTFRYTVDPDSATLGRSVKLVYNGKEPVKIKGFWFSYPVFPFEKDAKFIVPGLYPPKVFTPDNFAAGSKQGIWRNSAPFAMQLDRSKSVIMMQDTLIDYADRGGADASHRDGGIRLAQSFTTLGHVRPGQQLFIGAGYLRFVDGDVETALTKIHDLMKYLGHVIPKDRPKWFEEAITYSFHPGGTIGSQCKDLGGFVPATKHLDRIKELGCNSIWLMPLEDKSIYWPRDYYKFQDGLGTTPEKAGEEYKALVDRAHELGMKVLQDSVPHGGSNTYQRMIDHPEWLAQEEDGSTLHYWCADFNWPTWIEYMADVSTHYVKTYGIDGYRVDACGGSKIPNWNPKIPYARASHSQSQGGLNMLRAIRKAVKDEKPDGAILAEVQGSVFGAVSDAVYDFELAYNVLHDARKQTPEEFVKRLRRWLHEQQYSEIPDLLRLRHVESHDSLRAQLWYGTEPHRALMALTTFIHGIPLVYHEQETGHLVEFQEMFAYRRELPELNGGDADYLCVDAPPGVFAVLRGKGGNASVVLINFNDTKTAGPVTVDAKNLKFDVALEPFAYKIASIRGDKTEWKNSGRMTPKISEENESVDSPETALRSVSGSLAVPMWNFTLRIDPETGLLTSLEKDGVMKWGPAELFLPPGWAEKAQKPVVTKRPLVDVVKEDIIVRRSFDDAELKIEYAAEQGVHIRCEWSGKNPPSDFAMSIPVLDATHWILDTFEGRLADWYMPRHLTTDGVYGSIYWRPQGTNVLVDSLLNPVESVQFGSKRTRHSQGVWFHESDKTRFRLLDRIGEAKYPTMLFSAAAAAISLGNNKSAFSISLDSMEKPYARPKNLRPTSGGWIFENEYYRLRLTRSGTIMSLEDKTNAKIIHQGDLYTDYGYGGEKMRYAAGNDVEAGCRIVRDGDVLRLRFEGQLRGFGRFDLMRPPVEYFTEYALTEKSPAFSMSCGVKPNRVASGGRAFLALLLPMPDVERFEYFKDGKPMAEGTNINAKGRGFQTKENRPDRVLLKDSQKTLLELTDLKGETSNLFLDRKNFFVTFDDGAAEGSPGRWRTFAMTVSRTENSGRTAPSVSVLSEDVSGTVEMKGNLLVDGGFESLSGHDLVSPRTGAVLKGRRGYSSWQVPTRGSITRETFHSGKASARIDGETAQYRFFAQDIPLTNLKPGRKLRLSAWVKGEDLKAGPERWQVGCVRFVAVVGGQTRYASGPDLTGSFDWKEVGAEWTVPEKLERLSIQAGSNGAAGTVWIDDVSLFHVSE